MCRLKGGPEVFAITIGIMKDTILHTTSMDTLLSKKM